MRLKRLDLTRYGKFTDHSIDFGERETGRPDLHIVYGPNEAGKSTALAAFLDLLFGIETRSRFNFLHPYNVMRIGASLEFADGVHELVRIKRERNTLLDGNGLPVAEGIIAGQLGGIDRDSYRAMFSLDDDTLEAGGESILASKGDLGQLLFSASTGLADISRTLANLRGEADGFYRYQARAGELSNFKARLATLKEERDRIDTAASKYVQLIEIRDRALNQYDEAIARRAAIQSRIEEIQRWVSALPRLTALRGARDRLRPLADLPAAPIGWSEALPNLQQQEIEISVRSETIDGEIAQRSAELEALVIDEAALKSAGRVDRLGRVPQARYVSADKDIPDRLLEVREEELTIAGILGRVGRSGETDPGRLVLGASTVGTLRDLIEKRSGVEAAIQAATNELSEARHRLEESAERLRQVDTSPEENDGRLLTLAAVVTTLRDDDHAARRRLAERSRAAHLEELKDRLLALHPFPGDVEQLAALQVPEPGSIQRWKSMLAAGQMQHDKLEDDIERLKTERLRLETERHAIASVGGVLTDLGVAEIRAAREAAWAGHRRTLDPASADHFEAALRRDDIVMNARLRHETDIAKLHQTSHALARIEAESRRAQEMFERAGGKLRGIEGEIAAAATSLLMDGATVVQLEAWLDKREKALATRGNLRQAERDLQEADADSENARKKLMSALDAAGVKYGHDADVDALHAVARTTLDRETELKALRADAADRNREVKLRERNLEAASKKDRTWQAAWVEVCSGCWLGESGSLPSLAPVRETLSAIADLGPALERRASLMDRIGKMRDDQLAFMGELAEIARTLELDPSDNAPLELAQKITARVQAARNAVTMRSTKTRELDETRERQRELLEARMILGRRKAEMTGFFNVGSLNEVAARLSDAEKKMALEIQVAEATREILDALKLQSIEDAERVLDNADRAALDAELAELKLRFDDQDQRTRDLFAAHGKAADQVESVGGDAAVASIEEQRRTILLEIEDGARRYLRLRAGIVAAEHALRSYRQHHRSSMMAHASDAFRTISREAYSGLASQPNKENEILIAVAANGSSKIASELSKGTRFQLYLALRVAGYHEFARMRPSVPFVADDIMETFDDFRAEEAIRLLTNMGEVGQVIYLTHHRHLCDMARLVCPGVRVHELSPVPV